MSLNDAAELTILDYLMGSGINDLAPATWYLAVSTADPGESGSTIAEPVGNNYSRAEITNDLTFFENAVLETGVGTKRSRIAFDFPLASGVWGTLTHWGLFLTSTGGTPFMSGVLSPSQYIESGDILRIPAREFVVSLT
jgi:hypothetical protein